MGDGHCRGAPGFGECPFVVAPEVCIAVLIAIGAGESRVREVLDGVRFAGLVKVTLKRAEGVCAQIEEVNHACIVVSPLCAERGGILVEVKCRASC